MTKIKLCGLTRLCDIEAANMLSPEYIGFVFARNSKRCVSPALAEELKRSLSPAIQAVGVFVNEPPAHIASLLNRGIIEIAQLHGNEDEEYLAKLRQLTDKPLIKSFRMKTVRDLEQAAKSSADYVLLDSGAGTGTLFDWNLIENINRRYFLAGGLSPDNVAEAVSRFHPYAVDVSSGIETNGVKDREKMTAFTAAVRKDK